MRRDAARLVFGCASVLLSYPGDPAPGDPAPGDLAAVRAALGRLPHGAARARLEEAVSWLASMTPAGAAALYVETFDLDRRRALHLTYYRHGDTRERGMALATVAAAYRAAGLRVQPGELPDFLPALLELAAVSPEGTAVLKAHRAAIEALRRGLDEIASPWSSVVASVTDALGPASRADSDALHRYRAEGPPSERVGLEPFAPPEVATGEVVAR